MLVNSAVITGKGAETAKGRTAEEITTTSASRYPIRVASENTRRRHARRH